MIRPGSSPGVVTEEARPTGRRSAAFQVDALLQPSARRELRQLPHLLAAASRLVWAAAPRQLTLTLGLQVAAGLTLALQVILGKRLLGLLLADGASGRTSSLLAVVLALSVVLAISSVVSVVLLEVQRLLAELVARAALTRVIDAATRADLLDFESPAFHDRLQRAVLNASARPLQMTTGVLAVGRALLAAGAVGLVLLTIDPLLLVLGIAAAVPITLAGAVLGRSLYRFAVEQTPTDRQRFYIQSLLVEKDPAKELRAYQLALPLRSRFDQLYDQRIGALRALVRRRMAKGLGGGLLTAIVSGGTLALLILLVSDDSITLAGAGAAAAAFLVLAGQMQSLAGGLSQLYESALFIGEFDAFVEAYPALGGTAAAAGTATAVLPPGPPDIELRGVSFTYPSRSDPSIRCLDLRIRAGEVVALVGENGSGKTTLAKLLAGLYPPADGSIRWGGVDLHEVPPPEVRARVAVLHQDFLRYALSAAENIAYGRWERAADGEGVDLAAEQAGAASFIRQLPRGYETFLGPQFAGGSDLSGGQWQRVGLARAFFRDADLVILDEPTAALDPRAEAALFSSVRALFARRSVVLISHRFATVRHADHIFVLGGGRVVEHGDHGSLMARKGTYAELFTLQAAAFDL